MGRSFSTSIRRVGKMTKREIVIDLMRIAGAENDDRAFMRLLIENPIKRSVAAQAWRLGCEQGRKLAIIAERISRQSESDAGNV